MLYVRIIKHKNINMKKYFTLSNCIFFISILISTLLAIIFSSKATWMVWVSGVLGVLSSKMSASGKWSMFIFDIFSYILYIFICIQERYYGEMILSYVIILINIFCLLEWRKNQENDAVIVYGMQKKEISFSVFVACIILIIYAIALFKLNSSFAFLNAISTVTYLLGSYFCYRRSILQFYSWICYEIVFISLWIISAIYTDFGSAIFLIGGVSELIYDIIGIFNWRKLAKRQNKVKSNILYYNLCKKMKW